ncbi:alpha-glucan family phosphorylase [Edaphobacter sp.]|uniref:alpha-glucan family phosphorylase n=1 Tax=Edaphobacter sp. TaxID=1934404 RepID=UPI002DBE997F|nr:alpha-glucan family phosphorylase [Edaphobacter sp.]HEU5340973.1 alpha-glucan family phosphorylase [Edaphobacter sp.]
MSDPNAFTIWPKIEGIDALAELALNLRWSWNHAADELWEDLDSELWEATRNPWVILRTVSKDKIKSLLGQPQFRKRVDDLLRQNRESFRVDAWFQKKHPEAALTSVVYFSMEFMLSEALPIYSGGLGNVAGDQMKAASDLGVPVTGVGLLWGQGYFRQDFDSEGRQRALYPVNDPGQLPIWPLRRANGEWLRFQIQLPGSKIWLRCWEVVVGRTKLYLLDTNDFSNSAAHRGITSELYSGDAEMRLKQEIVLGIGGWRLMRALGMQPEVCHLNEGHAAFAVLERARCYMEDNKKPFDLALNVTRAGNVFTTHTAVTAGFDRFDPELVRKYLSHYAQEELGISLEDLLALGREDPENASEPFNMAWLAVRGSGQINGVSKLHGQVSRRIFQSLFPRWPEREVPIGSVTNGIHVPTWDSAEADALWTSACGKNRWREDHPAEDDIRRLTDEQLWKMRTAERKTLVGRVRERYARQLAAEGGSPSDAGSVLDENVLTLGFARRFATYKRPNLLLHNPERLVRLLSDQQRPVQLILAGKAHPQDLPGQALIQRWNDFLKRPEIRGRAVFLSDYDMLLAQELVQGIDLWVNTPRRPWEACGTSGMKILVNGGLNLSELDGWWAEAYSPDLGWALGDGMEHGEDPAWDAQEADTLYTLLEREVIPQFYEREEKGMPSKWLRRIRESMTQLTPEFSATRAIREYTEDHYLPAASGYRERAAKDSALGINVLTWQQDIARHWSTARFGGLSIETHEGRHAFRVEVFQGDLKPNQFKVELYAEPLEEGGPELEVMTACKTCPAPAAALIYSAEVPATRPAVDYTPRIVPHHASASVPLEARQILWQR